MTLPAIRWDGNPIARAGIYSGVPIDDYHRHDVTIRPALSSSGANAILRSPKHFYAHWSGNPNRRLDDDDAEWKVLGRAVHWMLLGEPGFANQFAVRPDVIKGKPWQGNRSDCKDWLRDQRQAGKTVLTPPQIEQIKGMAVELGTHPLYQAGALEGDIERSLIWIDPETSCWLKARPDVIPTDSGDVCDLKTTQSVLYPDLQRTLYDKAYYRQAALVGEGLKMVAGIEMASFSLVFIEKSYPHCVRIETLDPEDIARGHEENIIAKRRFADCLTSGRWPGPGAATADGEILKLSRWARESIDARLRFELPERHPG